VSPVRRGTLQEEIERGLIREAEQFAGSILRRGAPEPTPTTGDGFNRGEWLPGNRISGGTSRGNMQLQGVIAHSPSFKKQAACSIGGGGTVGGGSSCGPGAASVERLAPEVYSPLFTMANLNLPRDRITVNAWIRNFFDLHPLVRNAITLHATYPISKLNIKCPDKKVEQEFEDMIEEMDLLGALGDISLEYWKLGEKVEGSSLVTMSDGTLKPIKDVCVGDFVLTHLGNKKRVLSCFAKPTNKVIEEHLKIYKIHTMGVSEPLIISGKHPVLSTNSTEVLCETPSCKRMGLRVLPSRPTCSNCGKPNTAHLELCPKFVETNNLHVKDIVYAPFNSDIVDDGTFHSDLCYLIGFWLAEGCYCKAQRKKYTKYNGIKFTSFDGDFVKEKLEPLSASCTLFNGQTYVGSSCGFGSSTSNKKLKYSHHIEAEKRNGPELARFFLKHCGEYSKSKKMSEELMLLPPLLQLDIIAGFIDGDGCVDNSNGHFVIGTSSCDLANQIVLVLRRAGAHPTISSVAACPEKNIAKKYRIKVVANEAYDLFKTRLKSNKANLLYRTRWSAPRSVIYGNWQVLYLKRIEDITESFHDSLMYDIEVEDDHSYIANGIAIHNCFPYAELDENSMKWKRIVVQNPDYIHIKKMVIASEPVISLRPDAVLQRLVMSNNPADVQLRKQIPQHIIYHVRRGENIPLDNFNVSHLKMLSSPYDVRGTSLIVSVFKDLMLYDKLREAKFAQADDLVNPITIVKVGGTAEGEFHPDSEQLEYWRQLMEEAQYDKNFKIITHAGVAIERVGSSGAVLDISQDNDLIIKNIMHGLMVPQAVIDTESAVYASASIGLEVLRQRYFNFRNMLGKWLMNKIFAPISDLRGYYKAEGGYKKLIVPEVEWNQMNLYDLQDYISNISGLVTAKQVSLQTLYRSLGLNYEEERQKMRNEAINDAIRQREEQALASMSLIELRALDPEREIMEPTLAAQPLGMPGGAGAPGAEAGMPPMGGGGAPPMGGGGGGGLPGGLPELAPPPGEAMGGPGGAGAPLPGGVTPPLGPGGPGAPAGPGA
jgi:hypothetical protein